MAALNLTVMVVTGGGSGTGAALCCMIAAPGLALLVHAGSNRDGAEAVAAELRAAGTEAAVQPFDALSAGGARRRALETAGPGGPRCRAR